MIFKRRFADLVARQIDLFETDNADLITECAAAEAAYDRAPRDEAEERYGDYLDLVESGTEALADLRDAFARTLAEDAVEDYERTFNRAATKRLPRFTRRIEET